MQRENNRLRILFRVFAVVGLAAGPATAQQPRSEGALALVGGRLIDGFGGPGRTCSRNCSTEGKPGQPEPNLT